ncbi:major facilitator superfamily domain-containing protein 4A-like [Argopecten irradians]|uniref:major facilitator superfamily domain-containing protein 4A-like n=1 Tax=Argopecten irradians TaxID=31199 RepID=UPI00370FBCDF
MHRGGGDRCTGSRCGNVMYRRLIQDQLYRQNVLTSLAVYGIFAVLGGIKSQLGPAFLDLQSICDVGLDEGSWIVTSLYIGYTTGALANGFLYQHSNSNLLFGFSALGLAVILVVIPWCTVYGLMVGCHSIMGLIIGLIDAAGNAEIIRLWKTKSKTTLVGLHVIYNVGGVISPLIIAPFLARKSDVTEELTPTPVVETNSISLQHSTYNGNSTANITQVYDGQGVSRIYIAYILSSVFCVLHTLWFSVLYFSEKKVKDIEEIRINKDIPKEPQKSTEQEHGYLTEHLLSDGQKPLANHQEVTIEANDIGTPVSNINEKEEKQSGKINPPIPRQLQITGLVVMVCIGTMSNAIDFTFSTYLSSFCVEYLYWSKTSGSMITSLLFIMVVIGGTLSMLLSKCINSVIYVAIQVTLILVALLLLTMSINLHLTAGVWFSAPLVGFAKSAIFPLVISWTNKTFIRVSGRVSSVFFVGAMGGCSINLFLMASVMERMGKIWFCYVITMESIILIVFFVIAVSLSQYVKRWKDGHEDEKQSEQT